MKKKRAIYNLIMGMGSKLVLMVLGFIIPKVFIENYGSDINGLLSSISQVFAYLGLVEAGIGVATTQALYRVVAKNDWDEINGILNGATKFYKRTGTIYLIGVILIAIIYPLIVQNPIEYYQVFLVIIFSGLGNVLGYFFQAKFIALLNTEGKTYVHVAIGTAISIFTQVLKIVMVSLSFNIVFIYFVYLMVTLLQTLILNIYMRVNYKNKLNRHIAPNTESLSQHNSVLVHQISSLVFSNTDMLVLTAFTSLEKVSIYTIYNMVVSNINTLISTALDSFTSALGLTYNEDKDNFNRFYDIFELVSWIIYFVLMSTTLLMYEPFIKLYTANADISYVDNWLPLLFVVNTLLSMIRMPGLKVMNIEGCFSDTKSRTIIETVINLTVSLIAVQFLGIYGVLLGTTAALLYRTVDIVIYSNNHILKRNYWMIIRRLGVNILTVILIQLVAAPFMSNIKTVWDFILYGVIVTPATAIICLAANALSECKNKNIKFMIGKVIQKYFKRKAKE